MSVLPDHEIERLCKEEGMISPYTWAQLQPASYDVGLDSKILIPARGAGLHPNPTPADIIDLAEEIPDLYHERVIDAGFVLYPGQFILGATRERVNIPSNIVGRIEGKSSVARLGITAHITAGYLDPGFRGNVTLEIVNLSPARVRLWPGIAIAQLGFEEMTSASSRPYGSPGLGSHYQDADGVEGTRYGK